MAFWKSDSEKLKILVTGAQGFLGKQFVKTFRNKGCKVIEVVHKAKDPGQIEVDLTSEKSAPLLTELLTDCDYACFLAAAKPSPTGAQDELLRLNGLIDLTSAKAFAQSKCPECVYISGLSIFRDQGKEINEKSLPKPGTDYEKSKLAGENHFREQTRKHNKTIHLLRVNAPYGPGMPNFAVVAIFLDLALKKSDITVFGKGEREQHFTFAPDVAKACLLLYGTDIETCHFTGPDRVSMLDLAKACKKVASSDSRVIFQGDNPGVSAPFFAEDRLEKLWPRKNRTGLEKGLADYHQWLIKQEQ